MGDIGFRIKSVRGYTSLNRKAFCEKHGLNEQTLKSWENAAPAIRDTTLKKFVQALKAEGIICSIQWLRLGTGNTPYKLSDKEISRNSESLKTSGHPFEEVEFFLQNNPNGVAFKIPDDTMLPFYQKEDYVGGRLLEDRKNIPARSFSILTLQSGEKAVRKASYEPSLKKYMVSCTNPLHQESSHVLEEQEILEIAEIIWHRKMQSS